MFPNVDLAGGACFFVRDSSYIGECNVKNYTAGSYLELKRPLNQFDTFIRSNKSIMIVEKIVSQNSNFLSERVSF